MSSQKNINRGDVWLVSLDPVIGHETSKTRPAVVIQNDIGNEYSPITIIAPITSQKLEKTYPVEVFLSTEKTGLEKNSKVLLNQIRAVDMRRLIRKIGKLDSDAMKLVDNALKISLGLESL